MKIQMTYCEPHILEE